MIRLHPLVISLFLWLGTTTACGEWTWTPKISLSERYSDNIGLRSKGFVQGDLITRLSPGLTAQGYSSTLKADLDFSLHAYLFANDSSRNRIRTDLHTLAQAELLKDWFYLDLSAYASQQPKDYVSGIDTGDGVGIENTRQTFGLTVSPFLIHRFASDTVLTLRVSRNQYYPGDPLLSDSGSNRYQFNAEGSSDFMPLYWRLQYDRRETDYARRADTEREQASAYMRARLRRKFGVTGQVGFQRSRFPGASELIRDFYYRGLGMYYTHGQHLFGELVYNFSDAGNFMSGRLTLQPTPRTQIIASSTQRDFGRTHTVSACHRTRKASVGFVYQEDLISDDRLEGGQHCDAAGEEDLPYPSGCSMPHGYTGLTTLPGCERYLITAFRPISLDKLHVWRLLAGHVSYRLRRAEFLLNLYEVRRLYQEVSVLGREDRLSGLAWTFSFRPAKRTSIALVNGLSHFAVHAPHQTTENRAGDLWHIALTLTRRFYPDISGSLEFRHQDHNAKLGQQGYKENAVALHVELRFR